MSQVSAVATANFETEVLKSNQTVLVDFWAEWCTPCKMLSPVIDKVATQFDGELKIVKCNVDENPELAARYGVRGIPNLIFFKDGIVVNQVVGSMSEAQLAAKIGEVVEPLGSASKALRR